MVKFADIIFASILLLLFTGGMAIGSNVTGIASVTATKIVVTGQVNVAGSEGAVPANAVVIFNTTCPPGWTRQTQYDSAMVYGAATYSAIQGGAAAHSHTIGSHTHTTGTYGADAGGAHSHTAPNGMSSSVDSAHTHMQPGSAGAAAWASGYLGACAGSQTGGGASGGHTITGGTATSTSSTHTHGLSGSVSAATGTLSNANDDPAYVTLVFCSK